MLSLPLDHIGITGFDMDALIKCYGQLGFQITPRNKLMGRDSSGNTIDLGQESAHIMFADSYVELTAVTGNLNGHHLADYLAQFTGLQIIALATHDAESTWRKLGNSASDISPPQEAQREVLYGNGGVAQFRWFQIMKQSFPAALICYVEQVTPEVVFQPAVSVHANGVMGIKTLRFYSKTPRRIEEQLAPLAKTNGTCIDISDALAVDNCSPVLDHYFCEIEFTIKSIAVLRTLLTENNVPFEADATRILVAPESACGVGLIFCQT